MVPSAAMRFAEFEASLHADEPPAALGEALTALWFDKKGDFDRAHSIAQEMPGADGSRIHAYLHRKEGDLSNARYWYRRAGYELPRESLEEEWAALVRSFL